MGAVAIVAGVLASLSETIQPEVGAALDIIIANIITVITSPRSQTFVFNLMISFKLRVTHVARDGALGALVKNIARADVGKRFLMKGGY